MAYHVDAGVGNYLQRAANFLNPAANSTVMLLVSFDTIPVNPNYNLAYALLDNPATYVQYVTMDAVNNILELAVAGVSSVFSGTVPSATTMHLTWVQFGTIQAFYLNGVLVGQVTKNRAAFAIGFESLGNDTFATGGITISACRQWQTALTPAEIVAEMHSTSAVRLTNLFMDCPLTSDLLDDSGLGHDWTKVGTGSFVADPSIASRLYLTCRSPGTRLLGEPQGDWTPGDSDRDNRGQHQFVFLLSDSKTDGGVVTSITGGASRDLGGSLPVIAANLSGDAIWVSPPLSGSGTLTGTLAVTWRVAVPGFVAGSTGFTHLYAYIANGNTRTFKAVLANNLTDSTGWDATQTWRTAIFTLTDAAYVAGDRIVLELGCLASPESLAPFGDSAFSVGYGTTNAAGVAQADATNGTTGVGAAWVQFSSALSFAADRGAPPLNDACADATAISAIPYADGPYDTTGSTDTNRSVWYTWTPSVSQRVYANVWGGNYGTTLQAFTGGCGALHNVFNDSKSMWVGTSQSAIWFDAVAGTPYWFQISSLSFTAGQVAQLGAKNSGGAICFALFPHLAYQAGDLFVDCQHIVAFRGLQPFLAASDFYNNTPTGNVIDTTARPLDDANGGVNTGVRLYVGLFGNAGLVEILDLATLNNGEFEIDFILDALTDFPNRGQNIGSLIFDQSGNLLIGWYGDNYSVIGGTSTPSACAIRRLDATHADSQPGAPWPEPEAFLVAQDVGGSPFIDLAVDQTTVFYTSSGTQVLRYDLNTTAQLANFATLPVGTGPRPGARGLRLLPPGDGTGGLIVSYGNIAYRLNAAGSVIQSYVPSATERAQDMDKVELNVDATIVYISDQYSCSIFGFNVNTAAQVLDLETHLPPGQLSGFEVVEGYRAGVSPNPIPPPPTPTTVCPPLRRLGPVDTGCIMPVGDF